MTKCEEKEKLCKRCTQLIEFQDNQNKYEGTVINIFDECKDGIALSRLQAQRIREACENLLDLKCERTEQEKGKIVKKEIKNMIDECYITLDFEGITHMAPSFACELFNMLILTYQKNVFKENIKLVSLNEGCKALASLVIKSAMLYLNETSRQALKECTEGKMETLTFDEFCKEIGIE